MKTLKAIVRLGVLLGSIALFLVFLNSADYRAWVAGGPPNDNPERWLFSAWNYLLWSLAFLITGIGIFQLLRKMPTLSRGALALLILAGMFGFILFVRHFFAIDSCLDSGGKWSREEQRCIYK